MIKIFLVLISAFILVSPVLGEEKIVFEDMDNIYLNLYGFKQCQEENISMQEIIRIKEDELVVADKQINLFKDINSLCNAYSKELDLTVKELSDITDKQGMMYNKIVKSDYTFMEKAKNSYGNIGLGIIIGFIGAVTLK